METIEYKADTIATITLNRPTVHNAINDVAISELHTVLTKIAQDPSIRAVILNANGRHFCAGADLNWMKQTADYSFEQNKADALRLAQLFHQLAHLNKPVIAAVQGRAMGGGSGLITACDIVLATTTAEFCFSEVKLGLTPATIAPYVIRRIGPTYTNRYFITAEMINAEQALACHLIDEICDPSALLSTAVELASSIAQNGPKAVAHAKNLVNTLHPIDATLADYTATELANIRASAEAKQGMQAFFTKQKPNWL